MAATDGADGSAEAVADGHAKCRDFSGDMADIHDIALTAALLDESVETLAIEIGIGAEARRIFDDESLRLRVGQRREWPDCRRRSQGELTAHRTLALRNALANEPAVAFQAVLHNFVLATFYRFASSSGCLEIAIRTPTFPAQAPGLKESASAEAIDAAGAALTPGRVVLRLSLSDVTADVTAAMIDS
jgi:hypothetical protein